MSAVRIPEGMFNDVLVVRFQLLEVVLARQYPLAGLPDVFPEQSGEHAGHQEADGVRQRGAEELGPGEMDVLGSRGDEDAAHLEIQHRHVGDGGDDGPDHRPLEERLEAPQQDDDDVHEREDAVVQPRGEHDDGDERHVHERLEDGNRKGQLVASPQGEAEKEPSVGEDDGRVKVFEPAREEELGLLEMYGNHRREEGEGDPGPHQQEVATP